MLRRSAPAAALLAAMLALPAAAAPGMAEPAASNTIAAADVNPGAAMSAPDGSAPGMPADAAPSAPREPSTGSNRPSRTTPGKPPAQTKPLWSELSADQRHVLAPLASEWDTLDGRRKSKWLAIAAKFSSMNADEQQRVQERMRDWIGLTPEQRRIARESYARARNLDSDQKSRQWQQYQQLSEERKKELAQAAAARQRIVTLPPASQAGKGTAPTVPLPNAPQRLPAPARVQPHAPSALQSAPAPASGQAPDGASAPAPGTVPGVQ